ncbi:DUF2917 domain-containing protein [Undibacterium sp.]|jgi:hypothetical protein|uniref:DUF2917 domain-containing protein n=1 Tax=Undibacterium sp. TaxID=1914977 RepID=UPI002CEDB91B|nr:DUF2917 domain-containing protein [Undibacterium sp.]HTD05800.1 DUF2917 domain-containing protein [Undibacterium sp.]
MEILKHIFHFLHRNAVSSCGRIRLSAVLELERRSALAICHDAGVVLQCSQGSLWVTQLGNAEDTVLGPGQQLQVEAGRDLVIQAFSASTVQIALRNQSSGTEPERMTVNFIDKWYRRPQSAARPRFSVEGPFGLSLLASTMGNKR